MKKMERIGIVGGIESHVVTQNRLRGYMEAYESAGIEVDKDIIYVNADREAMIDRAVEKLLEADVDCIVCLDDAVCMQVLNKLRREHVKVPKQMKVASFYDSSILENHVPTITSLSFNVRELGMTACRILLDMIEGKEVEKRTLLGYEVILKESTK